MGSGVIVIVVALITIIAAATGGGGGRPAPISPGQRAAAQVSVNYDGDLPVANFDPARDPVLADPIQFYVARKATRVSPEDAKLIAQQIFDNCQVFDVNPKLATAVIERESRFDPKAVSSSGAMGLGQLLPSTASNLGVDDPFDITQGAKGAVRYIRLMLDRWVGNPKQVVLALASYKEGYGTISRSGGDYSDETKQYIQDILRNVQSIL